MEIFDIILQLAGVLTAVIVTGIGVVPFTNFLKSTFNLNGNAAKWLSVAVAAVLGIAEALVAGEITGDMFSVEGLGALITVAWFVSQNFYDKHFSQSDGAE